MSTESSARIAKYNIAHITDTAMGLFFLGGIKETSVDEISKLGKISRVTIYKYFPTKLEIAVSVFHRYLNFWSPLIKEAFFSLSYPALNGFEQIHLQLSIYSKIHLENPAFLPFFSELIIIVRDTDIVGGMNNENHVISEKCNEFYFNAMQKGLEDHSICDQGEFEGADYLDIRKIVEGIFIRCYLCFGREHFLIHQKEVYNQLTFAVDKIAIAFLKP